MSLCFFPEKKSLALRRVGSDNDLFEEENIKDEKVQRTLQTDEVLSGGQGCRQKLELASNLDISLVGNGSRSASCLLHSLPTGSKV